MSSIERFVDKLGKDGAAAKEAKKDSPKAPPPEELIQAYEKDIGQEKQYFPADSSSVGGEAKLKNDVVVNIALLEEAGMLTPHAMQGLLADEYRAIKRPIIKNAFGGGAVDIERGNLVMVTSSLPGEGKTFTSINLALSMAAELDQTVLLVEADVAKPAICKYCGIPEPKQGMVDYLLNRKIELSDVLLRTNIPKLSILPAGRGHPASAELIGSRAMRDLMDELSRRYPDRVVIFDSPPLLLTNEAVILSGLVGQVLLVIESAKTQQSVVKQAIELLDPTQVVGVVLNKSRISDGASYGYAGGYGYGYGEVRGE